MCTDKQLQREIYNTNEIYVFDKLLFALRLKKDAIKSLHC